MGNYDAAPRLVQLGNWDVELSLLERPGAAWDEIVSDWLPAENRLPPRAPDDFPSNGWRVVHTFHPEWAHEAMILGAPSQVEPDRWVLVQLSRDDNGWQCAAPFSTGGPVPIKEERRAGLRLDWAKTTYSMATGSMPEINVVLVNESLREWTPTAEDTSHVQGLVLTQHGEQIGNGWYATGSTPLLPTLQPGQEAMLPAFRNNPELKNLSAGDYQMVAFLAALNLRTVIPAKLTIE
ncbi:hypothetical protein QE394_003947 [Arthrobacter sp. SORGH_AS 212]|uniref:hypothetical protein n=1 Tax=Pseudarthrobacter sp. SORGH_AS 212 TaxID=3041777 RepID=UPI002781B59E|nr:hypothetical protein [Arthrobacter sp. SORGH_AS_0212]